MWRLGRNAGPDVDRLPRADSPQVGTNRKMPHGDRRSRRRYRHRGRMDHSRALATPGTRR